MHASKQPTTGDIHIDVLVFAYCTTLHSITHYTQVYLKAKIHGPIFTRSHKVSPSSQIG